VARYAFTVADSHLSQTLTTGPYSLVNSSFTDSHGNPLRKYNIATGIKD